MIINLIHILSILLLSVIVHEGGHALGAILCGIDVEEICIGFGKWKISTKIKGIKVSLALILLGGFTKLKGEYDKRFKRGFLKQRYYKKAIVLLAGVFMNLLVAFICYLINYKSILTGLQVDWLFLTSIFTKDYSAVANLIVIYQPNYFLLNLSLFNMVCVLFNLIPMPSLDGSLLWLVFLERPLGKKFGATLQKICWTGFVILMLGQLIWLGWWLM